MQAFKHGFDSDAAFCGCPVVDVKQAPTVSGQKDAATNDNSVVDTKLISDNVPNYEIMISKFEVIGDEVEASVKLKLIIDKIENDSE